MLPVIGLALDLVGALLLTLGLFRAPQLLYPGWGRSPDEVAEDRAYGTAGAAFLAGGFTLQAMPSLGVSVSTGVTASRASRLELKGFPQTSMSPWNRPSMAIR
jgi:hypothetical protein